MKMWFPASSLLLVLLASPLQAKEKAYYNARIYTADKQRPQATAMVVNEGTILYVGDNEGAKKIVKNEADRKDMQNSRILPGFIDTHCHPVFYGAMRSVGLMEIDESWDHETLLKKVAEFAEKHPDRSVIFGMGFGTACKTLATELDKAVSDRPVLLLDSGCHTGWINSKAIAIMGLTKNTPDPMPGIQYFVRDTNGVPTGGLVEALPEQYAWEKLKIFSPETVERGIRKLVPFYAAQGVTGLFDAGMFNLADDGHKALRKMEEEGCLTLRCSTSYFNNPTNTVEEAITQVDHLYKSYKSPLIHPGTLKMQCDGTMEGLSASMLDSYSGPGASHGCGTQFYSIDKMYNLGKAAAQKGYNVHIHAIGDKAVSDTLTAFEKMGPLNVKKTMAHVQLIPKDGIERFRKQKDIFYQTTPVWLAPDEFTEPVLGSERFLRQMPLKSIAESGVSLTFGSDCPASDGEYGMNPIVNIQYAVLRNTGDMKKVIPPMEEGITVSQAVDAYTINAAKQLGMEKETGSLAPGKSADFIVLDHDIFSLPVKEINKAKVKSTYFQGKLIYSADSDTKTE